MHGSTYLAMQRWSVILKKVIYIINTNEKYSELSLHTAYKVMLEKCVRPQQQRRLKNIPKEERAIQHQQNLK